jgi:hypothetical protein
MNASNSQSEMKDEELVQFATKFLKAYSSAAGATLKKALPGVAIPLPASFTFGAGGIIELTEELSAAQSGFVHRAAKLLKSKAAHEKAISNIATNHAHEFVAGDKKIETAVTDLIKAVFEQGNASFKYLAPNYLIRFNSPVNEIKIGRVRALLTDDFSSEWELRYPGHRSNIVPGEGFSLLYGQRVTMEMRPICWIVDVDAVAENVQEEGKWLIDVAVSFLRLSYPNWSGHFPGLSAVEPHPLKPTCLHNEGAMLQGSSVLVGGGSLATWYEIDEAVAATSQGNKFISQAETSLAERVSQGLGWLTRGRQAEDRAERFLYFFTAIEALLSMDDKSAPVVQTIARHAAVLLTNDNAERAGVAKDLKNLYEFRSSLVHAGHRSVLWSGANYAQVLAEVMFQVVLEKANLKMRHESFSKELAAASYGTPWPPATAGE